MRLLAKPAHQNQFKSQEHRYHALVNNAVQGYLQKSLTVARCECICFSDIARRFSSLQIEQFRLFSYPQFIPIK